MLDFMMTQLKKLVPVALLCVTLGGTAAAQSRIATVDLPKVFEKYWKTQQATAALKDQAAEMEKSRDEMVDGWKKSKDEYQKLLEDANNQAVSAEERDRRKQAAEDKLKELKATEDGISQFDRQSNVALNEKKARMRKNILEEIKQAIISKAKAGGYTLVVDSSAQTYAPDPSGPYYTPSVLYWDDKTDLTESVLAQLNTGAPVAPPKSDNKPADSKDATP